MERVSSSPQAQARYSSPFSVQEAGVRTCQPEKVWPVAVPAAVRVSVASQRSHLAVSVPSVVQAALLS